MDALGFLKAKEKMCRMHPVCIDCPAKGMDCVGFDSDATDFEKLIQIVGEWSREHPRKTRQDEFLKLFPNSKIKNGCLDICPRLVNFDEYTSKKEDAACIHVRDHIGCDRCKSDFWNEEVE